MEKHGVEHFRGRLGLQQRVLPTYRAPFFDHLAEICSEGLSVYAGHPRSGEGIHHADRLDIARYHHGRNLHLFRAPVYLCWQYDLQSWLQGWNPDALIMEANPRYLASRAAITWMQDRGRPVLGWGLGAPESSGIFTNVRMRYRKRFVNQFDVLIAYSEQGAEEYISLDYPAKRIVVAHNAVAPPPTHLPERTPLSGRAARVIFVGRLQARKRVDLLLRACSQLDPQPELMIIGDGPERATLEMLADDQFPKAEFPGSLFEDRLQHALASADIFVLPGTGGLAVQQAMAAGLPVIVATGDGTQNDLVTDENGWLIPSGDVDALVEALKTALSNPAQLLRMGAASYDLAVDRFNIDAMRKKFLEALMLASEGV